MYTPGYYKTNYRALRFRELRRMHGLTRAFKSYWITRFMRPSAGFWMPGLWADTECKKEDLSDQFWQAAKPHCQDFERLGFTECRYSKITKTLNPWHRDSGGIIYLDPTRRSFGQFLYTRLYHPATGREINRILVAFTAAFQRGSLSCASNSPAFDSPDENEVIRIDSERVIDIYQEFQRRLQKRGETPRSFPDFDSLREWFDARQVRRFEEHVRRGLFTPMNDQEVAYAQAALHAGLDASHGRPRIKLPLTLWAILIAGICILQFIRHQIRNERPRGGKPDTIEYHGHEFKMRKAYATYEDYKDDPDNLDMNERAAIEQTMLSLPVPMTFKNYKDFTHFLISDFKFPGYGLSMIGGRNSDDGSKLLGAAVEIPHRDKDRIVLFSESNGQWNLVDDFVFESLTNQIRSVKIEQKKLRYFDQNDRLVHEKVLESGK